MEEIRVRNFKRPQPATHSQVDMVAQKELMRSMQTQGYVRAPGNYKCGIRGSVAFTNDERAINCESQQRSNCHPPLLDSLCS